MRREFLLNVHSISANVILKEKKACPDDVKKKAVAVAKGCKLVDDLNHLALPNANHYKIRISYSLKMHPDVTLYARMA